MKKLQKIKHKGINVLTSKQLANCYETNSQIIRKNFERNKEKYIEGKHYYILESNSKIEFCNTRQIDDSYKKASKLYLWTERGALLHAKSLNTDKAWEIYELLMETYFRVKEIIKQQPVELPSKFFREHYKRIESAENTKIFLKFLNRYAKQFNLFDKYGKRRFFSLVYNNLYNGCFNGSKQDIFKYLGITKKNSSLADWIYGAGLDFQNKKQSELLVLLLHFEGDLDSVFPALLKDIKSQREVYIERLRAEGKELFTDDEVELAVEFFRKYPLGLKFARIDIKDLEDGQEFLFLDHENNHFLSGNLDSNKNKFLGAIA